MTILLIFLVFFTSVSKGGETYGVILSGGGDVPNNYYRYFMHAKEMHAAFRSAGITRDHIITLHSDGGLEGKDSTKPNPWTLHWTRDSVDTPVSLEGDGVRDIRYPANSSGISSAFDELSRKLKPGDNVVFFISDHGSPEGVVLWKETYPVAKLQAQLKKLPQNVKVQIVTHMCFGGQLLELTDSDVCVVANTDDKHVSFSYLTESPFVTGMVERIKKSGDGRRVSLMDAFLAGRDKDLPQNIHSRTSIDFFLESQENFFELTQSSQCDTEQSPITSLKMEIDEFDILFSSLKDPRKHYYEKYFKKKLEEITRELDTLLSRISERVRTNYQSELSALASKWSSLSPEEQIRPRIVPALFFCIRLCIVALS